MTRVRFCNTCGGTCAMEQRFCNHCGQALAPLMMAPQPAPQYAPQVGPHYAPQFAPQPQPGMGVGAMLGGRWELVRQLGRGGMGSVWLVRDLRLPRRAALKEMLDNAPTPQGRGEGIARFNREADTLATLQHENCPHIYDRFTEGASAFLVMEFIEGSDLEKVLGQHVQQFGRPLAALEVARLGYQLANVLEYLHAQEPPVIHRDLKPSNLMITAKGTLKLIDFGIAKATAPAASGTGIGTHGYASPEQYRGHVEPRSDLYALGATLHHLLSGRDPQQQTPFDFPPILTLVPDLPPVFAGLVDRLVSVQLENRPVSATEVKQTLLATYPHVRDAAPASQLLTLIRPRSVSRSLSRQTPPGLPGGTPGRLPAYHCPQCQGQVAPTARFCNQCGYRLTTESFAAPGALQGVPGATPAAPGATHPLRFVVSQELSRRPVLEHIEMDSGTTQPLHCLLLGVVPVQGHEFAFVTAGPAVQPGAPVEVYVQRAEGAGYVFDPIDPAQPWMLQAANSAWQHLNA